MTEDPQLNQDKLNLVWINDLLFRMQLVLKSDNYTDSEKVDAVKWLIKQALKIEAN